jgi:hypothetical protein
MRSSFASWFSGLMLAALGAAAMFVVTPFPQRFLVACLMVFLVDAFGGRWFSYAAGLLLVVGLFNDPTGHWVQLFPLVVGSLWAALLLRHTEPGFLGVGLSFIGFALPVVALVTLRSKIDPNLTLPLGSRFLMYYLLSGAVAIVLSSVIGYFLKRSTQPKAAKTNKTVTSRVRVQR